MDVMHNVYPIVSKYFLQKRGLDISTFTRRYVGAITPNVIKKVDQLFDDYMALRSDLKIQVYI